MFTERLALWWHVGKIGKLDSFLEKSCLFAIIRKQSRDRIFRKMVTVGRIQKGIYKNVSVRKASGVNYTPRILADFVADEIIRSARTVTQKNTINIFDPAFGDGQLLDSLLQAIYRIRHCTVRVHGYETDEQACATAIKSLSTKYPDAILQLESGNFLSNVPDSYRNLLKQENDRKFDLIIANPPYVRTQILGAEQSKLLAKRFNLTGRVDLYYAFIAGMSELLSETGHLGMIVSNRFMTTKSGTAIRQMLRERYKLLKIWDFGDTKLFEAAVLPAVLLVSGGNSKTMPHPSFTSIYETNLKSKVQAKNPIEATKSSGIIRIDDGRAFNVQHGFLNCDTDSSDIWRIETQDSIKWLKTVSQNTVMTFGDIGKIRVGVKTTADKVFIRSDWSDVTKGKRPELLRPLITHHVARQFRAIPPNFPLEILYPHEVVLGERRACDLSRYPNSAYYLRQNKKILESRDYVIDAGRQWYEIWVPQDPAAWSTPKLVFRDISEKPMFWINTDDSVVNGDCYWLANNADNSELLWLAVAIANSTFIEMFYDYSFCNKLYSGRRRFITQYVEKFPMPDHASKMSQKIIGLAKTIYNEIDRAEVSAMKKEIDKLVWQSFGLVQDVGR